MDEFIYNAILNPICKNCNKLGDNCLGKTIKDWEAAKECHLWNLGYPEVVWKKLDIKNYLLGSDTSKEIKEILDNA